MIFMAATPCGPSLNTVETTRSYLNYADFVSLLPVLNCHSGRALTHLEDSLGRLLAEARS
jgi:hypothetical protein